ncbi:hypothetical protein BDF19DRAFT_435973 [Syncephalis fuscata]|nr:hypothetical protein BDF19DRAFT_435973 [Syncephalis fuscata]
MKSTLLAAGMALALVFAVAADPDGYPGVNTYRLIWKDTECMRILFNNGAWFKDCAFDDPLDFDVLWQDTPVGDYITIKNIQTGQCMAQGRPMTMETCNQTDSRHLWRYLHKDEYPANNWKIVSKISDDQNNGHYSCFVRDKTATFEGHAINLECNGSEETQFFTKVPAPATLPRY